LPLCKSSSQKYFLLYGKKIDLLRMLRLCWILKGTGSYKSILEGVLIGVVASAKQVYTNLISLLKLLTSVQSLAAG
jgi:hypothetical protein